VIIPVHLNILSIVPLLAGVAVLCYFKPLSRQVARIFRQEWKRTYGEPFPREHERFFTSRFVPLCVILAGVWLLLGAWVISLGPISTGSAAGDYQAQTHKDTSATSSYNIESHFPPGPDAEQRIDQQYIDDATSMTTDELYRWLITAKVATTSNSSSNKEIQAGIFLDEFEQRVRTDSSSKTQSEERALLEKYSPCWEIPESHCQE
jgi:hypothetical protein